MGCAPYRHPFFITAQALSIIAFFLSITWWLALILGLAALIMLQVCWCCKMNRCGLITAGVFACIAAIANFITGFYILSAEVTLYCGYDDDYYSYSECSYVPAAIVTFVGAVLWIVTAIGVFVFTCKMDKYRDEDNTRSMKQQQQPNITINVPYGASEYPQETVPSRQSTMEDSYSNSDEEQHAPKGMSFFQKKQPTASATTNKDSLRASTTTIVREVGKDGSKKTTKTVTNPDGSQNVTVTVEEAVGPVQGCLDPCGAFSSSQ